MFKSNHPIYADLSSDLRDVQVDWNVAVLRSFEYPLNVSAVAVEPITGLLAVGTATGTIHIFGGPSVETRLLIPEPGKVKFLQFSSSTFQIVCLDERSQLHIFDLSPIGRPRLAASAKFDNANSLTLSPSHSHAFIATESGEIRTYDLQCLRRSEYRMPNLWQLYEEKTMANRMEKPNIASRIPVDTAIHPRDLNLLFVAYSGGVILSDLTQRNTLRAYEFVLPAGAPGGPGYGHPDIMTHRRPDVTAIAIHPAGHFFAVGYSDGCIAFWAIEDEDQPLLVRTLDDTDVNVMNMEELEKPRDAPPPDREPIYKLAWSSFSDSSDPRGGHTALTTLGGLLMTNDEPTGLNVHWLPPFNPTEPPAPAVNPGLHPFMRSAMQASLVPLSDLFYETPGIPQDFFLMPRSNPHFAGHFDPNAILISIEVAGGARVLEAFQFPPPAFLASSTTVAAEVEESQSVVDDLASTLRAMTVDNDPHSLRLPLPLSFPGTGISGAHLCTLEREAHDILVSDKTDPFGFPLKGGVAWSDDSKAREMRLAKFQKPRILITQHRNLASAVQFHDASAQLLIVSDTTPIENHFPQPLPSLTIDLKALLTDAAAVKRTSPSFHQQAEVQSVYLATQALECAVQLASGEVIVFRLKSDERPMSHTETVDEELVHLGHIFTPENSRFAPYFLLTTGKPVSACAISDIGFLAVAYSEALVVVDMRGPRVIFRYGRDKKRHSLIHSHDFGITCLTWSVTTLENDPQLRVRLIVGHSSGTSEILTLVRQEDSTWKVDPETKRAEAVASPLPGGTFIVDPKVGAPVVATREQLSQSFHPAPPDTHRILVTAGAKGARCLADVTGSRISRVEWGSKVGTVQTVQIVEKMGSHSLVAFTDAHEVLAFSLPQLEHLGTMQLPVRDASMVTVDTTGDWMACTLNRESGVVEHASYGTLFDFRRAYTPPDIEFKKPVVPAQPQPAALGPASLLSSWFRFGQSMTGDQLDILLGGPDRPIPKPALAPAPAPAPSASSPSTASSIAQSAAGVQSSLYARLQSAVGERGQMLGDLEDRFNSLEEGSRSMVAQAKRLAATQGTKSWFGL
ncbi:WD40 containing snare-dependent exocytosis protein [Roridomyces roridus]|uniref:WD40 containing snare-dependent exocytosis protein n=1 Tax=Roridomyces roridus TaxID=1738132 RepID=A0AAD7BVC1_9AGAR|nr:WD40 containing snare-dependent exocytosis protein [Roridomyces roridus]